VTPLEYNAKKDTTVAHPRNLDSTKGLYKLDPFQYVWIEGVCYVSKQAPRGMVVPRQRPKGRNSVLTSIANLDTTTALLPQQRLQPRNPPPPNNQHSTR